MLAFSFNPGLLFVSIAGLILAPCKGVNADVNPRANGIWPAQSFKSVDFQPPNLLITKRSSTAEGYLFFGQAGLEVVEAAPLIMTDDNDLIWQGPSSQVMNFGVQTYQGNPVLVYWNGALYPEPIGRGYGFVHLLNQSYDEIALVTLPGTFFTLENATYVSNIDMHELFITSKNTVVVTANNVTQFDLRSIGGPEKGWIVDSLVYEIDIATNQVLFRWSALDHVHEIPLTLSQYPLGSEGFTGKMQSTAWGYFHINAASPWNGGYLISSRYLCSAIAINAQGNVTWILKGTDGGDFELEDEAKFCYQHHIRAYGSPKNFTLHIHNNANSPLDKGNNPTTGLSLTINRQINTASLSRKLYNRQSLLYATAQGSYQALDQGHVLLGHGILPIMEEFSNDGSLAMNASFGPNSATTSILSYRTFRSKWVGCPNTIPNVVLEVDSNGRCVVYMSWNGATQYNYWYIYASDIASDTSTGALLTARVDMVKRTGFETKAVLPLGIRYVQVEAVVAKTVDGSGMNGWDLGLCAGSSSQGAGKRSAVIKVQ